MKYEALIFEGGGMKGLCYVGALLELSRDSFVDLSRVYHFGGTSAGSIIATLLASNYTFFDFGRFQTNSAHNIHLHDNNNGTVL